MIRRGFDKNAPRRSYLGRILIAADRLGNAVTGGLDDETWSQSLGLDQLRSGWRGRIFGAIVDAGALILSGERDHCIRALYRDDDRLPIFPDRMPSGAPGTLEAAERWAARRSASAGISLAVMLFFAAILVLAVTL